MSNGELSAVKPDVDKILAERGNRYGSFKDNARISQALAGIIQEENDLRHARGWDFLLPHQLEALEMIAHKMARILSGDAEYADNWIDIAGYAQLGLNPR